MTDEKFVFVQEVKERKQTARSAWNRNKGKYRAVKLPSDYLTRKELKAMSGEVKSYRLNDPMKWAEYKELPDDLRKMYLEAIKTQYHAPWSVVATMLGVSQQTMSRETVRLGLNYGKRTPKKWNKDGFYAWINGVPAPQSEDDEPIFTEEFVEIPIDEEPVEEIVETKKAIPTNGMMTFTGSVKDALETLAWLLEDSDVCLTVSWEAKGDDHES